MARDVAILVSKIHYFTKITLECYTVMQRTVFRQYSATFNINEPMRVVMNRKSNPLVSDIQNYWDPVPNDVRHSPKQVGTQEYFDKVEKYKKYEYKRELWFCYMSDEMFSILEKSFVGIH